MNPDGSSPSGPLRAAKVNWISSAPALYSPPPAAKSDGAPIALVDPTQVIPSVSVASNIRLILLSARPRPGRARLPALGSVRQSVPSYACANVRFDEGQGSA